MKLFKTNLLKQLASVSALIFFLFIASATSRNKPEDKPADTQTNSTAGNPMQNDTVMQSTDTSATIKTK